MQSEARDPNSQLIVLAGRTKPEIAAISTGETLK